MDATLEATSTLNSSRQASGTGRMRTTCCSTTRRKLGASASSKRISSTRWPEKASSALTMLLVKDKLTTRKLVRSGDTPRTNA